MAEGMLLGVGVVMIMTGVRSRQKNYDAAETAQASLVNLGAYIAAANLIRIIFS